MRRFSLVHDDAHDNDVDDDIDDGKIKFIYICVCLFEREQAEIFDFCSSSSMTEKKKGKKMQKQSFGARIMRERKIR